MDFPQPPYGDVRLPPRFQETPFEDLPRGLQVRVILHELDKAFPRNPNNQEEE